MIAAIHDQIAAGLDVITDGEQTRLDFNLSFYGYLEGIELGAASPRRFGPPAHDQRGQARSHRRIDARRAASARSRNSSGLRGSRRRGPDAQGQRARAVYAERPAGSRTPSIATAAR